MRGRCRCRRRSRQERWRSSAKRTATSCASSRQLQALADRVRDGIGTGVVILGGSRDGKAALFVAVTKDVLPKVSADSVIKAVQGVFGAKGGERPESASAGGGSPAQLGDAVTAARTVVRERLDGRG